VGHEEVWDIPVIVLEIPNLSTWQRWMVSFTLRPVSSCRRIINYPLFRPLGGSHSRSERGSEEENHCRCREYKPSSQSLQGLIYPGSCWII